MLSNFQWSIDKFINNALFHLIFLRPCIDNQREDCIGSESEVCIFL